jgi:3'-5' exonuclease
VASQVAEMVNARFLPQKLKILLANPRILKVGLQIQSDISILEDRCGGNEPFRGIVDLGCYARDRYVITGRQSIGLSDLCALVLNKCLRKNVADRVGEGWERETLTNAQIEYAAGDAYASLEIYHQLSKIPPPTPLARNAPLPPPGTPILVFNNGTTAIARGQIVAQPLPTETVFDGVNLSATNIVVQVDHVLSPGALVLSHKRTALKDFGPVPFCIVANQRNLRLYQPISAERAPTPPRHDSDQRRSDPSLSTAPAPTQPVTLITEESGLAENQIGSEEREAIPIGELVYDLVDSPSSLSAPGQDPSTSGIDSGSRAEGLEILGPVLTDWSGSIHSRVLKDAFHVFNQFYIPAAHGLRVDFSRALSHAMFIPDPEDARRIEAWGQTQDPKVSFDYLRKYKARWLWKRCKRIIPPPAQLYPAMREVLMTWGPLKDATTQAPLFNKAAWKTAKHILDLASNGFISDPPGIPLYSLMGIGKDTGLPVYRCFRGTNATEGGVHTHLRSHLPSSGTSVEHALMCLLDFVLRRNLLVRD